MARDTSFYYSFLVLPARRRRAIVAVWDFCRAVDDAVDEAAGGEGPVTPDARAIICGKKGPIAAAITPSATAPPIHRCALNRFSAMAVRLFGLLETCRGKDGRAARLT